MNVSPFREVFGSEESRAAFSDFLDTIFHQLEPRRVFRLMDEILRDEAKSEEQIYRELVNRIGETRKRLSILHQIHALSVLVQGMGTQTAKLLQAFSPRRFHSYAEVYFRRYLQTMRKIAGLPLKGPIFSISDRPPQGTVAERVEAGAWVSSNPYATSTHVPLNDPDCASPDTQPEKTYAPLGETIQDTSLDLVSFLGGLHHIPHSRLKPFLDSLGSKMRPGGVLLVREHNAESPALCSMISVVHSFVNAANGTLWEVEKSEIRTFRPLNDWITTLTEHGWTQVPVEGQVLPRDPTHNTMLAFTRTPRNFEELRVASRFRKDSNRSPDGTRATWIEWGNVRYSDAFAQWVQKHHAYAFDYLGALREHGTHFIHYIRESRRDLSLRQIVFSDNFAMNLFILVTTFFECLAGFFSSLPSRAWARCRKGVTWRKATDRTALEIAQASIVQQYAQFIHHTPFYQFPYLQNIPTLWSAVKNSQESWFLKLYSYTGALLSSIQLLFSALVCIPLRKMYMQNGQCVEPEKIGVLLQDPENVCPQEQSLYTTQDGGKLLITPRYRPFTDFCKVLSREAVTLHEIGGQSHISIDVRLRQNAPLPTFDTTRHVYTVPDLQDPEHKIATYYLPVLQLLPFIRQIGAQNVVYVHE